MSRVVLFKAGEVVFRQGYPGDYAYIIQQGEIEIYHEEADGTEKHLALLGEGEMFGELALTDDAPRSASARAATDCSLQIMEI